MMSITTDQMYGAASFLSRNWGETGYRFTAARSVSAAVTVFTVRHFDGSEFGIAVDKWGNAREMPEGDASAFLSEMHREAVAS